jgi:curved DNA-binding protein CbpA
MEEIIIDNVKYDCYFILGVTPTDSVEQIQKTFKKKAKLLHPDKLSLDDKKNKALVEHRQKHFNILVACFNHLINKKQSYLASKKKRSQDIRVKMSDNLETKQFDNHSELNSFNDEFDRMHVSTPNDFGYEVKDRLTKVEDYEAFNYTPVRQFNSKQFNNDDFNKAFEYHQEKAGQKSISEGALIHKTTDGFYGYNTGDLGNAASVSSYNGVMIIGDNFGSTGIGYSDSYYSDYKQSFSGPSNPETRLSIPQDFTPTPKKNQALTKSEMQKQLALQQQHRNIQNTSSGPSRMNFRMQEDILIQAQQQELKKKEEQDKQFILQYQHMYDQNTIQDALNKRLLTSADYTSFEN